MEIFNNRCLFCGKPKLREGFPFCSEECKSKHNKITLERSEKGLCVICGNKARRGEGYPDNYKFCIGCGGMFQGDLDEMDNNLKKAIQNGKQI